ncbi:MAG TPA: thioredoxin domain-containing protein [Acidimicrobiia bacterium]
MPNRLADSTSPYLVQHADNPVDWWEWSDEAFVEARRRDVPVLLSVGYAACHWCHVMAHESFEDVATAEVMNERFVNIKVDREERPDIDSIYMEAVQAMTGQGGWPMTVWMTPDGRPFYAGTYFPNRPHHGMPAFTQVLDAIWHAWTNDRRAVIGQSEQMVAAISRSIPAGEMPAADSISRAVGQIVDSFDTAYGGFGGAPKFPQQPVLDLLLRSRGLDPRVDDVLRTTLRRMADGGIHDQLGGGFARYSVDRQWLVPHFEKMLYDNAQLARIYLWAGIELGEPRFLDVARSTLDYLLTDLHNPDGGFYSAEDADSEGEEGTFYVWTRGEFESVLGQLAETAASYYGVTDEGNFEGANVLHKDPAREVPEELEEINARLLAHRNSRVRPGLDDKLISAWNGLAIRALAEAGAVLNDDRYLEAATDTARFVLDNLADQGRLQRSWRDGRVSGPGFLDDHAAMAVGCYTLFSATGVTGWFEAAERLVADLDRFARPEGGGFYSTASDSEPLIKRPEDFTDNPLPSGNALAAEALLMSSLFTADLSRRTRADEAIAAVGALADRYPSMVGHHLAVAHSINGETHEVAIVGEDRSRLVDAYWSRYRPETVLAQADGPTADIPLLADRTGGAGVATAYVCRNFTCNLPTGDPALLLEQLAPSGG